jgi:hypothetical protein
MVVLLGAAFFSVSMMVREGAPPRSGARWIVRGWKICQADGLPADLYAQSRSRLGADLHAAMTAALGDAAKALEDEHAEFVRKRAACFPAETLVELPVVYRCVGGVYQEASAALCEIAALSSAAAAVYFGGVGSGTVAAWSASGLKVLRWHLP